jgi:hypothetical protein
VEARRGDHQIELLPRSVDELNVFAVVARDVAMRDNAAVLDVVQHFAVQRRVMLEDRVIGLLQPVPPVVADRDGQHRSQEQPL